MSFQTDHKRKLESLIYQLHNIDELKKNANGGNTVLFTFPPHEEEEYIQLLKSHFHDKAEFIDLGSLFVKFIDLFGNIETFKEVYSSINPSNKVFKSDGTDEDYFDLIIQEIQKAENKGKIPILTSTGSIFSTGIENQNIMENKLVMDELKQPLIILYPSILKNDELYFLGIRKASKYRCIAIE
jgi:hypothetical protein